MLVLYVLAIIGLPSLWTQHELVILFEQSMKFVSLFELSDKQSPNRAFGVAGVA
jgi:hypothetical protein